MSEEFGEGLSDFGFFNEIGEELEGFVGFVVGGGVAPLACLGLLPVVREGFQSAVLAGETGGPAREVAGRDFEGGGQGCGEGVAVG